MLDGNIELLAMSGWSIAMKVLYGLIAVFGVWLVLRAMDKANNFPWGDALEIIRKDSQALSLYYSVRFAGICFIVAALLL